MSRTLRFAASEWKAKSGAARISRRYAQFYVNRCVGRPRGDILFQRTQFILGDRHLMSLYQKSSTFDFNSKPSGGGRGEEANFAHLRVVPRKPFRETNPERDAKKGISGGGTRRSVTQPANYRASRGVFAFVRLRNQRLAIARARWYGASEKAPLNHVAVTFSRGAANNSRNNRAGARRRVWITLYRLIGRWVKSAGRECGLSYVCARAHIHTYSHTYTRWTRFPWPWLSVGPQRG